MKRGIILLVVFAVGYYFGQSNGEEKIVYQPQIEYVEDPNSVSKSVLDSEVASAKKSSYDAGYAAGRKSGIDEGYQSGYIQGTEYGKSLILDQIDMRVKEAERTDKNVPLFKVKQE